MMLLWPQRERSEPRAGAFAHFRRGAVAPFAGTKLQALLAHAAPCMENE